MRASKPDSGYLRGEGVSAVLDDWETLDLKYVYNLDIV
jgi:hypothetical protein